MPDTHDTDKLFAGSIPDIYDTYLVPLICEPYAVVRRGPRRVAWPEEGARSSGRQGRGDTRALAKSLPNTGAIVATDLNQSMFDHDHTVRTARAV
jgi:hypothetical protein